MNHYTMLYKYGWSMHNVLVHFHFFKSFNILVAFLIKQFIPLVLVGYEMIIANLALGASLAI